MTHNKSVSSSSSSSASSSLSSSDDSLDLHSLDFYWHNFRLAQGWDVNQSQDKAVALLQGVYSFFANDNTGKSVTNRAQETAQERTQKTINYKNTESKNSYRFCAQVSVFIMGLISLIRAEKLSVAYPQTIYLWGGVGRGKTAIMDLFFDRVPLSPQEKRRMHYHDFMRDIGLGVHGSDKSGAGAGGRQDVLSGVIESKYATIRLLCLDELFVRDIADAMLLQGVYKILMARGITVVLTSNVLPDDLYKNGLQRVLFMPFINYLRDHAGVVEITSAYDYRIDKKTLPSSPSKPSNTTPQDHHEYHDKHDQPHQPHQHAIFTKSTASYVIAPLGEVHERVARRVWGDVCSGIKGNAPKEQRHYELSDGRILKIRGQCRGISPHEHTKKWLWLDASILNDQTIARSPMGLVDFIELANNFNGLLLSHLDVMGSRDHNKIARLIELIDIWYDRSHALKAVATVYPHQLFVASEHRVRTPRTVSRMIALTH